MGKVLNMNLRSVRDQLQPGGEPPDNGDMQARIAKLESLAEKTSERLGAIEKDVSIIKSNYATKEDLARQNADVFKAMNDQTWKIIGAMITFGTLLSGIVFYIARNVR
jgi:hypothetical protein